MRNEWTEHAWIFVLFAAAVCFATANIDTLIAGVNP